MSQWMHTTYRYSKCWKWSPRCVTEVTYTTRGILCKDLPHTQHSTTPFLQSCTGTSHSPSVCLCVCVCVCAITCSTITILQSHLVCEFLIQAAKFLFFFFTPCFFRWLSPANSTSYNQTDVIAVHIKMNEWMQVWLLVTERQFFKCYG